MAVWSMAMAGWRAGHGCSLIGDDALCTHKLHCVTLEWCHPKLLGRGHPAGAKLAAPVKPQPYKKIAHTKARSLQDKPPKGELRIPINRDEYTLI